MPTAASSQSLEALNEVIVRHWGFRTLKPLQKQAMQAVLARQELRQLRAAFIGRQNLLARCGQFAHHVNQGYAIQPTGQFI